MTNQQHPITPPPELVEQWYRASEHANEKALQDVATQAARWGADRELEACCDSLQELWAPSDWITGLRAARRPKPLSLKEQALAIVCRGNQALTTEEQIILRRALEQLDD